MSHYLLDIQYFCLCLRNIAFHIQFYKTEYMGHICSRLMCFQFVTHSDTGRALSIFWRIPTVLIPLRISFSKFFDKYIIFVVIKYLLLLQFLCWMQGWGSGSVVFFGPPNPLLISLDPDPTCNNEFKIIFILNKI